MQGFIIEKYKQQTKQQPVPSLKSIERQKPSEPPAQPRAAMGTSVLLHISLGDLESGRSVSLLGLTQPCEDDVHRSKKKGEKTTLAVRKGRARHWGYPEGAVR